MAVIALLTDFGWNDPFAGQMKGVILSINPAASIVDLAHGVPRHDVRVGALLLKASYPFFPEGTVFVAVIDPGVGSPRRAIAIKTERYFFVGPDNGVLAPAALEDGVVEVVELANPDYMLPRVSRTFHGRDVFAPVAAHISRRVELSNFGPKIDVSSINTVEVPRAAVGPGEVRCSVVYVDSFGNVVTSASPGDFTRAGFEVGDLLEVETKASRAIAPWAPYYAYVPERSLLVVEGSFGLMEVAVNRGRADDALSVSPGDEVVIRRVR